MNTEKIKKKLEHVNAIIEKNYENLDNLGIFEGLSGPILFQFYYNKYLNNNTNHTGYKIIDTCIERINNGYLNSSFSQGIGGLGWIFNHLNTNSLLEIENDEEFKQFDVIISNYMEGCLKLKNYDLLNGAIGSCMYFLNRYKSTHKENQKSYYKNEILKLILYLRKNAIEEDGKIKWVWKEEKGNKIYNLGLAHGIPSIILILSELYEINDFKELTKDLIIKSISYLQLHKQSDSISLFPYHNKGHEVFTGNRVAWCYGDLGIGLSFYNASLKLDDAVLKKEAINILKRTAKRLDQKSSLVTDPYICHGALGNSIIFKSLYKSTKDLDFKKASDKWFDIGFSMIDNKEKKVWSFDCNEWDTGLALLVGISGIGMVLLDNLIEEELEWYKVFTFI